MKINVTAEHIRMSNRMISNDCMVARALKDVGVSDPRVMYRAMDYRARITGWHNGKTFKQMMDAEFGHKIAEWDFGHDPEPFEFELDLEPAVERERELVSA